MAPPARASRRALERLVRTALAEDRVGRDRTSRAVLPHAVPAEGAVQAQARGVVSGVEAARLAARAVGLAVVRAVPDGARVRPGETVLVVRGDARAILGVERTVLNLLMHASGVATATARAVRAAGPGPRALVVLATRKTLPGLRDLEKAAVVHGGGRPHRRDLADAILVKSNHLAVVGLEPAIARARRRARRGERVEVEVRTVREALRAARAGAGALLIDNASPGAARAIVRALVDAGMRSGLWVELSGGITAETVGRYRAVGADAVSLGALTHSAPALPFHLRLRSPALRRRPA
ncbi:MAG TPA: carboxylating nicotinate-nucleotide diphosphorylase [Thermoplasmata archaeon]|nr:carboxylating nicotinate-nucleotide diphosphorylase [Thermoplasmata archaeon]